MASPKEELLDYADTHTPCSKRPECCKPRDIKHVAWDADDTMWEIRPYGIATNITGKLVKLDDDTLEVIPTYQPPRKSPKHKKHKRWWQEPFGAGEPEDFFMSRMDVKTPEDELEEIEEELRQSLQRIEPETHEPPNEVVLLDEVRNWAPQQQSQVDRLLKRYGKGVCKIFDVRSNGTIDIDCRGDIWMLTKQGQLIGEESKPPAPKTPALPPVSYYPEKQTITLLPTFRQTLAELKKKGITSSVISLNAPGTVKRIVDAFGMGDDFVEVRDSWQNKGTAFDEIAKKEHVCPCNAMFVDNTLSHVNDVSKKCGLALQIGKTGDIQKPIEIMRYIK